MHRKYDPFINLAGLDRLQQELGKIFNVDEFIRDDDTNAATTGWKPSVDIFEDDNQYVIEADVPGVDPESIDIALKAGVLTLSGNRLTPRHTNEGYKRVERRDGDFMRRFTLPDTADEKNIEATCKLGVLTITIVKKVPADARKIHVVSG